MGLGKVLERIGRSCDLRCTRTAMMGRQRSPYLLEGTLDLGPKIYQKHQTSTMSPRWLQMQQVVYG